uniref:Putative chaperonin n=1 Tax=viral metagenome TaxID=1070528 RepID=A0A6M3LG99_9ZZZZ
MMINKSGTLPTFDRILIYPLEVEEKTKGGIYIPEVLKDKEQMGQRKAILVDVGPLAFDGWKDRIPVSGDTILLSAYPGIVTKGDDGLDYKLCLDSEVIAIRPNEKNELPNGQ